MSDPLEAIRKAGEAVTTTALQLQQHVDELTRRLNAVEAKSLTEAEDLVTEQEKVQGQQQVQDDRLTNLEP